MGDVILFCPLCCRKKFNSKISLLAHLSTLIHNIPCPICDVSYASIEGLIEHLTSDNCDGIETKVEEHSSYSDAQKNQINIEYVGKEENVLAASEDENCKMEGDMADDSIKLSSENNIEVNQMYVDYELTKPGLQSQELKLVLEDGGSRYVVLTNNDFVEQLDMDNAVVTKQNNDGTISLTTVKEPKFNQDHRSDIKFDADSDVILETVTEDAPLEIYSCNTCGVSFSSVTDHIKNYHNDQDVVVEEPLDETPCEEAFSIKDTAEKAEVSGTNNRISLRRMITETGDIIEAPVILKDTADPSSHNSYEFAVINCEGPEGTNKSITVDKQRRSTKNKQLVQKNILTTDDIKGPNEEEEKSGLYHKVVLQEMATANGNKVKIYNCISCNLFVPTLAEFKSRPCTTSHKYPCPHCPVSYENHKSLCAHMKIHKSKEAAFDSIMKLDFECGTCGTVFPTSKSLKLHKRMHDPIKSRPIEPPVSTAEGVAVNSDKYLCGVCDKLIPIDYREVHARSHTAADMTNCHVCNKKFSSREYLDMHISVHNHDKVLIGKQDKSLPYTCMYCERKFARPHEKVKHERIHTGEKPHSCEICGKTFRVSYCLTLHMRTHTGARPYACPHCGKRFKAHSVYNHHLLTHSEVRAYKCPYCPKAFKTSVQLAGHKNSHTKPFSCQQCNRPFASLYAVRVHMDSHLKQNSLKFACALCGASYARSFALKDHVRQAHQADIDAADALSGLKDEEWLVGEDDKDSIQPLHQDINQDINELEMNADELIVP